MYVRTRIKLLNDVTALERSEISGGERRCGLLITLPQGAEVTIWGEGFSERTVSVEYHGHLYFVFRQDIERPNFDEEGCDLDACQPRE